MIILLKGRKGKKARKPKIEKKSKFKSMKFLNILQYMKNVQFSYIPCPTNCKEKGLQSKVNTYLPGQEIPCYYATQRFNTLC
jgi:hypothetical protein